VNSTDTFFVLQRIYCLHEGQFAFNSLSSHVASNAKGGVYAFLGLREDNLVQASPKLTAPPRLSLCGEQTGGTGPYYEYAFESSLVAVPQLLYPGGPTRSSR
jgi:hypothetical protein